MPPSSSATRRAVVRGAAWFGVTAWCAVLARWVDDGIRHGSALFLHGQPRPFGDLYERFHDVSRFLAGLDPFDLRPVLNNTNPPVAIVLYWPFEALGRDLGATCFTTVTLLAVVVVGDVLLGRLTRLSWPSRLLAAAFVVLPAQLIVNEPLRALLKAGQVRMVLLALVAVDYLVVSPRFRGWLTGVAGGVALTPLLFAVPLAVESKGKDLLRVAGGLFATIAVGLIVGLHATAKYWLWMVPSGEQARRVLVPHRPGVDPYAMPGQASLRSLVARAPISGLRPHWVLFALLAAVSCALAWDCYRRALRLHARVTALSAIAVGVLLVGPITWNHYWCWSILLWGAAVELWRIDRVRALLALIVPVATTPAAAHAAQAIGPHAGFFAAATSLYVIAGVAWLVADALAARRHRARRRPLRAGARSGGTHG